MSDEFREEVIKALRSIVCECSEGHGNVLHRIEEDCPACKEISKRLTDVNAVEVKLALAEQKIEELRGTIDSLNNEVHFLTTRA